MSRVKKQAGEHRRGIGGSHDFGSFVLAKIGNLEAVINEMGHSDVRSAMVYQHPEREIIRNALNARHNSQPTVLDDNQANA